MPQSATNLITALVGLVAMVIALILLRHLDAELYLKGLILVLVVAGSMIAVDVCWFRTTGNPSSGLAARRVNAFSLNRLARKFLGFAATLAALYAAYWLLPEYAGDFYSRAWAAVRALAPFIAIGGIFYLVYVDFRQVDPEDAYAQLGGLIAGQSWPADWTQLAQHARGWLVKGFFLPLMFIYLTGDLDVFWRTDFSSLWRFRLFYEFANNALFIVDLLFACVGYLFTLRLLDTHIRSVEPTMTGWVVCIVCYQPFWSIIDHQYLLYEQDGFNWGDLTASYPVVYVLWGSAILACLAVYSFATAVFGLRFSNLTHRGIITSGPYRWTKHPAYISKCLSFWLVSIPFISTIGAGTAIAQVILLAGANGLYVARAITEERHLARDPVYREYQAFIREHGLLAKCRRLLFPIRMKATL